MASKVTKKENFGVIAEILKGLGRTDLEEVMLHEIELLEKKAGKTKATKTQVANQGIKETILNALATIGTPITITELIAKTPELDGMSNQKVSALITQLKNDNKVVRVQDKKVARFTVATDTEDNNE